MKPCRGNTRKWLPGLTNKAPPSQKTSSIPRFADPKLLFHTTTWMQNSCLEILLVWLFPDVSFIGHCKIYTFPSGMEFRSLEDWVQQTVPTHHTQYLFTSGSTGPMSDHLLLTLLKVFLSLDGSLLFAKEERSPTEAPSPNTLQ